MNISLLTVTWLRDQGHDAVHARALGMQRAPDADILARAMAEHRIVLTMDLDFGYLLAVSGAHLPSVILFRLDNDTAAAVNRRLATALATPGIDWTGGVFTVVTERAVRVRRLPIGTA